MANMIKMQTDEIAKFRQILIQMSATVKARVIDMNYLINTFDQTSSSMFILKDHMNHGVKSGNEIVKMLNKMAFDVDRARTAFMAADNQESTLFRGDKSNGTSSKKGYIGINSDNYSTEGSSLLDAAVGSIYTVSVVAAIDRLIGLDVEKTWDTGAKISPNQLVANLKEQGKSHDYRRGLVRDIPKGARDIEVDIPKGLKLAKGLGVVTVGLIAFSVSDDFKNNKTIPQKFEASGVDVAMTGAACGVGTGAIALVGGVCTVLAALASEATGAIKKAWHLW